jgi:inner membrane protein
MTTGGEGIALLAPWDLERYFLPWQVIKVSPIGIEKFFSEWGLRVIISEFIWVGIPGLIVIGMARLIRVVKERRKIKTD